MGEGPMTWGRILAAASAQEASVAEQAWADEDRPSGSVVGGGSWACEDEVMKQRSNEVTRREPSRITPHLDGGICQSAEWLAMGRAKYSAGGEFWPACCPTIGRDVFGPEDSPEQRCDKFWLTYYAPPPAFFRKCGF
jgi:hypothetical protein